MLKSVEGIFRNGQVELLEPVQDVDGTRVIVTFLSKEPRSVNLIDYGIGPSQALDLRNRLSAFAEDWDRPEMDIYDED